jgi:hypothetical protein
LTHSHVLGTFSIPNFPPYPPASGVKNPFITALFAVMGLNLLRAGIPGTSLAELRGIGPGFILGERVCCRDVLMDDERVICSGSGNIDSTGGGVPDHVSLE